MMAEQAWGAGDIGRGCRFSPGAPKSHRAEPLAQGTGRRWQRPGRRSLAEVAEGARQEARAAAPALVS